MKMFGKADARQIVERIIASVAAGHECDALLMLAVECLREAGDWLEQAELPERRSPYSDLTLDEVRKLSM